MNTNSVPLEKWKKGLAADTAESGVSGGNTNNKLPPLPIWNGWVGSHGWPSGADPGTMAGLC